MKSDKELLASDLCQRLVHGVKGILIHDMREDFEDMEFQCDIEIFKKGTIWNYKGFSDVSIPMGEGDFEGFLIQHDSGAYTAVGNSVKPILRNMSDLTVPITHKGETFVPLCKMFGLDADKVKFKKLSCGVVIYQDAGSGNFEPVTTFDIEYAKPAQVDFLTEHHFNWRNLPAHLWVDVNSLETNPYV